jgi:hypothetical protein
MRILYGTDSAKIHGSTSSLDVTSQTSSTPAYTILLYGATSYTGKLVIEYFLSHPELNPTAVDPAPGKFNFALAARNEQKLLKLRDATKLEDTDLVVCPLESTEEGQRAIEKMVKMARVVVNLAGQWIDLVLTRDYWRRLFLCVSRRQQDHTPLTTPSSSSS